MSQAPRPLSSGFWSSLDGDFGSSRVLQGQAAAEATGLQPAPLAVVFPANSAEVAKALKTSRTEKFPVVVFGSASRLGESFSQRLPQGGYLALGMKDLAGIEEINTDSLWVSVRAGTLLASVTEATEAQGLQPVGFDGSEMGTIGGWLSSHAHVDDGILGIPQPPVLSLEAVLPTGRPVRSVAVPRAATGPDLFSLFLGTFGGFGVITQARCKLEPLPERRVQAGFRFSGIEPALDLLKAAWRRFLPPKRLRAVIEGEAGSRQVRVGMVFEGEQWITDASLKMVRLQAERTGGQYLGPEPTRSSLAEDVPEGLRVNQAAVFWSQLPGLLASVERRLGGYQLAVIDHPGLTGCRLRVVGQTSPGEEEASFADLLDPDRIQSSAVNAARELLGRVRRGLDPDGLVNPHAWPLPWPGGGW